MQNAAPQRLDACKCLAVISRAVFQSCWYAKNARRDSMSPSTRGSLNGSAATLARSQEADAARKSPVSIWASADLLRSSRESAADAGEVIGGLCDAIDSPVVPATRFGVAAAHLEAGCCPRNHRARPRAPTHRGRWLSHLRTGAVRWRLPRGHPRSEPAARPPPTPSRCAPPPATSGPRRQRLQIVHDANRRETVPPRPPAGAAIRPAACHTHEPIARRRPPRRLETPPVREPTTAPTSRGAAPALPHSGEPLQHGCSPPPPGAQRRQAPSPYAWPTPITSSPRPRRRSSAAR